MYDGVIMLHIFNREGPDGLSWSSVQIHCQCTVSESRVYLVRSHQLSTEEVSTTACDTSFVPSKGERGMTVLSTKPKILFCDLRLDPGESKICRSTFLSTFMEFLT